MTPELLAMIKDVPAATDETLSAMVSDISRYDLSNIKIRQYSNVILSLIARIVVGEPHSLAAIRPVTDDQVNAYRQAFQTYLENSKKTFGPKVAHEATRAGIAAALRAISGDTSNG